jgi:tripartite-type tricarboxylate transporter receptor subunit TctC
MDRRRLLALAGAFSVARASFVMAQESGGAAGIKAAQDHFAGKTVRILISAAAGSGTDRSSRQFLAALQRFLPDTGLRIENLDRAGGQIGASELWRAPTDGSVVGFPRNNLFYAELMERETLDFTFSGFTFFGSTNRGHKVLVLGNSSPIDSVEQILSGEKILLASADAVNSSHYYEALLMNALTGSRISPVAGYAGGARNMAVISGEVDCQIGSIEAVQPIVEAGAGRIVFRLTSDPLPATMPDVPRLADHLRDPALAWVVGIIDAAARLGRPFAGPPGMEPLATAHWKALFTAVVEDAAFRAASLAEDGLVIDPSPASEIETLLADLASQGEGLRDKIESLLGCGQLLASDEKSHCG